MVRPTNLRSSGRGFDSRSGCYQATYINSVFHPSKVGKSSTGLVGGDYGRVRSVVGWQVTLCDPIWQATPRSSEMGSHKDIHAPLTFNFYKTGMSASHGRHMLLALKFTTKMKKSCITYVKHTYITTSVNK